MLWTRGRGNETMFVIPCYSFPFSGQDYSDDLPETVWVSAMDYRVGGIYIGGVSLP
jgi:hypothetical protein